MSKLTILQSAFGMGVVDGAYEKLKRYNLNELYLEASRSVSEAQPRGEAQERPPEPLAQRST